MKNSILKTISLCLVICMVSALMIPTFGVSAETQTASTNILSGMVPDEAFLSSGTIGTYGYAQTQILGGSKYHPYFPPGMLHTKADFAPFLATMTDDDPAEGYTYGLDGPLTFVYDLGVCYDLDSFSVHIQKNGSTNTTARTHVYVSTNRDDLFSKEIIDNTPVYGTGFTSEIQAYGRYVAIAFEQAEGYYWLKINNISMTGKKHELKNVMAGRLPVMVNRANAGTTTENNAACTIGTSRVWRFNEEQDPGNFFGFDTDTSARALTDESEDALIQIMPDSPSNYDMLMVYELKNPTDLYALELVSTAWKSDVDIHVSSNRADIFAGDPVATLVRESSKYTQGPYFNVSLKNVSYIGLHFKYCYQTGLNEIRAYGVENINGIELTQGKAPVAMYDVYTATNNFAFNTSVMIDNVGFAWFGFTKPDTCAIDSLRYLTDDYTITAVALRDTRSRDNDVGTAFIYKLDSLSDVTGAKIVARYALRGFKIYTSRGYASLFNSSNKVAEFIPNGSKTASVDITDAKEAVYVGIVLDTDLNDPFYISDIKIFGNPVERIVNEEVAGGKLPVNPNANTNTKSFYQYLNNVGESENILIGAHMYGEERLDVLSSSNSYYNFLDKNYVLPSVISLTDEWEPAIYKQYYDQGAVPLISVLGGLQEMACLAGIENKTAYIKFLDENYVPENDAQEELVADMCDEFEDMLLALGDKLSALEEAGVETYMIRPFNEMNVYGFYGDSKNNVTSSFKNVWKQMYEYLVDECELQGVIFVYCPANITDDRSQTMMSMYPGNDYVDVIGPTCYSRDNSGFITAIPDYDQLLATGKPFGMSETGMLSSSQNFDTKNDCLDMLQSFKTTFKEAAFASLWFGHYGINNHWHSTEFITDDYILNVNNSKNYQFENIQPVARATFSSATDFKGNRKSFAFGSYADSYLTDLPLTSLAVDKGTKITIFAKSDYTGEKYVFGRNNSDISGLDIVAASIKIEKADDFTVADINSDGNINLKDLLSIKKDLSTSTLRNELASDLNNDGKVGAGDMTLLCKVLLGTASVS